VTTSGNAAANHDAAIDCQTCDIGYCSPSGSLPGLQTDCKSNCDFAAEDTVKIVDVVIFLAIATSVCFGAAYFYVQKRKNVKVAIIFIAC
jgi:hypothetical protein